MNDEAHRPALTREDDLAVALEKGRTQLHEGDAEQARDSLEEAVLLAKDLDDSAGEAAALGLLAQACLRLDDNEEAAEHAELALRIATARRDKEAAEHFRGLLFTARSSPEEIAMSTAFGDGRAALADGDVDRAIEELDKALALAEQVGHKVAEGASCHLLAEAYLAQDQREVASRFAQRALDVATASNQTEAVERARSLMQVIAEDSPEDRGLHSELMWGQQALAEGDVERGIRLLRGALAQAQELGERIPEATARGLLAQALIEKGDRQEAAEHARHAVEIARDLEHEAVEDFEKILAAAEATEEQHQLAVGIQAALGQLEGDNAEAAVALLEKLIDLSQAHGNKSGEVMVHGLLAEAHSRLGNKAAAEDHARQGKAVAKTIESN